MPHPQDVAVPSLPLSETLALAIKFGVANVDFEEQAEIDCFLYTFGNACYEAGRAAGRASAEPEGEAEPVADARRFVYDEHVRPLRAGDDESFPGLSWYDFGSSRMHPCVINARGRTVLRDGDWIVLIGTQYHAFTPEVYALLAAPTPTASIAPQHCQCPACIGGTMHASDCAVHGRDSGAGIIRGSCDCGAESIAPKAEALPLAPAYAPCAEEPDGRCCGTGECWTCPLAASVTQAPKAEGEAS